MLLNQNWKIQWFDIGKVRDLEVAHPDYIDHFWMTAKVPGDVHSTLLARDLIENPFFGHNDLKSKWVEEKVWWYRSEFHFSKDSIKENDRFELTFEGLDTFATIYLNGMEIGSTENMFIAHTFDVTRELLDGRNIIAVKFDPVSYRLKEKEKNYWAGFGKDRIWARKAQSHFGWDWGPQILTVGIWKDVHLNKRRIAKMDRVLAKTVEIKDNQAIVDVEVESKAFIRNAQVDVEMTLKDGHTQLQKKDSLNGNQGKFTFVVKDPNLWWTHNLGEPHLYDLEVKLTHDGEVIDFYETKVGIRTIEVMQRDDSGNSRFTFVLNGVETFAKGANWIPIDSFIGPTPDLRYTQLIQLAKEGKMNMLRVWGGGIYERDVFYNECDRQGILIWQDFMFACALYPDYNRNYMENVREEVTTVIKRLASHPSIALWCGNNENDWLYEVEYSAGHINTPFYGETIYHELIPELLEKLDSTRFYWPSSPFGGNDYDSEEEGDRHNWQVWHGNREPRQFGENKGQDYSVEGVSFKNYKKDHTRFSSEFGMHASSNRYTLEKNLPQGSFYWGSEEMAYRNKDYHHQKGILLMEGYTGVPTDIEEYMNYSMLTQAEGLKLGIEHYRRNKPQTSGALVWQLNDCWPGTSWSMIDYYSLPKASYYYAKKFFDSVLLSINYEPGSDIEVWVVNDRLDDCLDELEFKVVSFTGEEIFKTAITTRVKANTAEKVAVFSEAEVLKDFPATKAVMSLSSKHGLAESNVYYFRDYKDLELTTNNLTVDFDQEKQEVTVKTDTLARFVKLDPPYKGVIFSDNFFDLLPGECKKIKVVQLDGESIDWSQLNVTSINSIK